MDAPSREVVAEGRDANQEEVEADAPSRGEEAADQDASRAAVYCPTAGRDDRHTHHNTGRRRHQPTEEQPPRPQTRTMQNDASMDPPLAILGPVPRKSPATTPALWNNQCEDLPACSTRHVLPGI